MPSDEVIRQYVERSFSSDSGAWYGIEDKGILIGAVHIHCDAATKTGEIGISIAKEYRGLGYSNSLFSRAVTFAKLKGAKILVMQCLSENQAMQHIARKQGMKIITLAPGEKEASVSIESTVPGIAAIQEIQAETLALIDANIRNQFWLAEVFASLFNTTNKPM